MFPQIFGKYVLEREIAAGGMAKVFLATLRGAGGFEKRLVVKQIRPELASDQGFIARFVDEAKTTVDLSHSNIVPVYELGVEQGTYYIAMEYCAGVSLNELLVKGALSPAEGAYVGVEICRALDYAHRRAGIIHRDVTPRNVMIDPEGMVRLIDFGIASSVDAAGTGHEALFGSPGHMPPEQLERGPLTPAADVFAVAALLVEAWTLRPPFRRESFDASRAALKQPLVTLSEQDERLAPLSALIASALALDPLGRPQTAEELARPLREFLRQSDLGDIARRLGERVSERSSLRPERWAASRAPSGAGRAPPLGVTQTFAVRDAVLEWTAKIATHPNGVSRPSVPVGAHVEAAPSSNAPSYRDSRAVPRTRGRARRRVALGLVLSCTLGAGYFAQRQLFASTANVPTSSDVVVSVETEGDPQRAAATASPTPAPPVEAPSAPSAAPPPTAAAPPARAPRARAQLSPAPREKPALAVRVNARVNLTAEPRALVKVDSAVVGRTPVELALAAGRHEFVFVNESLGEKLETRIDLGQAELHRLHADFTRATPQLYVR